MNRREHFEYRLFSTGGRRLILCSPAQNRQRKYLFSVISTALHAGARPLFLLLFELSSVICNTSCSQMSFAYF